MKITALDPLVARNGSELLVVMSTSSGEPVTYTLALADLVESAALLAFSSTDVTLGANSDELLPTQKATKAFVASSIAAAIAALVGGAPAQLDTLNELAAALANDASFAAAVTASLADKASLAQLAAAIADKVTTAQLNAAIAAAAPAPLAVEAVAATNYTLALADAGKHKRLTAAAPVALVVPLNATVAFPIGTRIRFTAAGVGIVVTIGKETAGVTLNSRDGALKSAGQFAVFEIEKVSADAWDVLGDLVA